MTKKFMAGLSVLGLVAVGVIAANNNMSDNVVDEVATNVEALAGGEIYVDYDKGCVSGTKYCIPNYMGPIEHMDPRN